MHLGFNEEMVMGRVLEWLFKEVMRCMRNPSLLHQMGRLLAERL